MAESMRPRPTIVLVLIRTIYLESVVIVFSHPLRCMPLNFIERFQLYCDSNS